MKISTAGIFDECMRRKSLTMKGLEKRTGISRSTLSRYKRYPDSMTVGNAKKISKCFGISIETLVNGIEV